MRAIDLWNAELRKLGVTAKEIEEGAQFADKEHPDAAKTMREEIPDHLVPKLQKWFAEVANKLYGKHLRERQ